MMTIELLIILLILSQIYEESSSPASNPDTLRSGKDHTKSMADVTLHEGRRHPPIGALPKCKFAGHAVLDSKMNFDRKV